MVASTRYANLSQLDENHSYLTARLSEESQTLPTAFVPQFKVLKLVEVDSNKPYIC